jgi:hypothetical protein
VSPRGSGTFGRCVGGVGKVQTAGGGLGPKAHNGGLQWRAAGVGSTSLKNGRGRSLRREGKARKGEGPVAQADGRHTGVRHGRGSAAAAPVRGAWRNARFPTQGVLGRGTR